MFTAVGIGVWLAMRDSINDIGDKKLRSRLQAMQDFLQPIALGSEVSLNELMEDAALAAGDAVSHREFQWSMALAIPWNGGLGRYATGYIAPSEARQV